MNIIDAFFFVMMVVLIMLLICAIVGKIIAYNKEKKMFEKTCCPIYTVHFENDSAA